MNKVVEVHDKTIWVMELGYLPKWKLRICRLLKIEPEKRYGATLKFIPKDRCLYLNDVFMTQDGTKFEVLSVDRENYVRANSVDVVNYKPAITDRVWILFNPYKV